MHLLNDSQLGLSSLEDGLPAQRPQWGSSET